MTLLIKLLIFLLIFLFLFDILTRKYINKYKLVMIFGKKGSGKTTYLTKVAIKYSKLGYSVYSTVDIPSTYKLHPDWVGKYNFPQHSVLLIDEVGMIWDNRDFKSFKPEVRDWFKLQRHNKCIVYLFSQTFDIDKKLRDLTDEMYLLQNCARVFSLARRIRKFITINDGGEEGVSHLDEGVQFCSVFSWQFTFIPRYVAFFDSFELPVKATVPRVQRPLTEYQKLLYSTRNYIKLTFVDKIQKYRIRLSLIKISLKLHKKSCNYYKNLLLYRCKRKGKQLRRLLHR